MSNLSRKGQRLTAWRVTGPTHNLLRLVFANATGARPDWPIFEIEKPPSQLDETEVRSAVAQGIADAGGLEIAGLCLRTIGIVGDDSRYYSEYRLLAHQLVARYRDEIASEFAGFAELAGAAE